MAAKRSYGTGSIHVRADAAGRETFYGKWRSNGTYVKRALGPKRLKGSREGLTRGQAEAEMRRLMQEIKPVAPASGEALTIAELGRHYVVDLERRGAKKSTLGAIETALRAHLEPFFSERAIGSVSKQDVADFVSGLKAKGLSPKSIHNYTSTLATLYRFAIREDWAAVNPCTGIKLEKVPDYHGIRYLEPDQIDVLIAHAQPGPYKALDAAMFGTAAMTGLRLGELCALSWRDVDWTASAIRVRSSWVMGEFGTPKSRRSFRSVPMADPVAAGLERYFKACGEPGDGELVFGDPLLGGPLEKTAVLRRLQKALKAAGLPKHRFHDLRHTFGTAMAAAGVPMRTLQEWMGHRDIQTTQRYADYAPRTRDAELVAAAFAPSGSRGLIRGLTLSESEVT
jgi:integrase